MKNISLAISLALGSFCVSTATWDYQLQYVLHNKTNSLVTFQETHKFTIDGVQNHYSNEINSNTMQTVDLKYKEDTILILSNFHMDNLPCLSEGASHTVRTNSSNNLNVDIVEEHGLCIIRNIEKPYASYSWW